MWFQLMCALMFFLLAFIDKQNASVFLVGAVICTGIVYILLKLEKDRKSRESW